MLSYLMFENCNIKHFFLEKIKNNSNKRYAFSLAFEFNDNLPYF